MWQSRNKRDPDLKESRRQEPTSKGCPLISTSTCTHLHTCMCAADTHTHVHILQKIKTLDSIKHQIEKCQYKIEVIQRSQVEITEIKRYSN